MSPRSFAVACTLFAAIPCLAGELAPAENDRLWLHRNLGAAYWANEDLEEAADELELARSLAPDSAPDLLNAGMAALRAGRPEAAISALDVALALEPEDPRIHYSLGILSKRDGRLDDARAQLERCREVGGQGPELAYNLGIVATRQRDLETAATEFRRIVDAGTLDAPRHYASALYRWGRTLLQAGQREEGAAALREYQELVKAGGGAQLAEEDLELGELMELARLPRPADVRAAGPVPAFAGNPLPARGELRWAEISDLDGDGDRDLLLGDGQTLHDLRWEGDSWVDVTDSRGLAGLLGVTSARALDLDNDGARDLVRGGGSGIHFHAGVQGGWDPPRPILTVPVVRFRPIDFDHEGDVDLVAASLSGALLARNNGDRTFEDVTPGSGLQSVGACVDVEVGDLDDDMDVDLVFVTRRGAVVVASSLRGGRFEVLGPFEGMPTGVFDVEVGDLDGDGDLDLVVAAPGGVTVVENLGAMVFTPGAELAVSASVRWPSTGGSSLGLADFDNDGRIDILAATDPGAVLALNAGALSFLASTEPLRALADAGAVPVAIGLVDGDDRMDLITSRPPIGFAHNAGELSSAIILSPVGVKNNRDGVGTTFELLAGARYQRRDGAGHPIHFGLGEDSRVDAVRVRWPNGIQQAVVESVPGSAVTVEEKAGLVGSCPFLYSWNGEKFEYITDILTVTPLGLPITPGMFVPPNWDEVIRLESDQLVPDADGMLTLQITEELREVTYIDQVRLVAIDHPAATEVQPNERFKFPPFPEFGIHVLDGARAPVRAIDSQGRNVAEVLARTDGVVVGDLPLTRYQGITRRHWIELDFGEVPPGEKLTLHLAGWFFWTNASINIAVAQDARHDFIPPQLWVRGADGEWANSGLEIGFPGGKTKSIPIDVTGVFPGGRAVFRLDTTLRLYWDRALLQVGESEVQPVVTELLPESADLHFRGHSEPILSITGEEPEVFEYDVLRAGDVPWDPHPGLYTRFGDVTELVQAPENMYVIMATGDECTVRFRADALPPLPPYATRTYFAVFDGWAKDGDPNTSLATEVEPLPFHGMSGYPYREDEAYPTTPEHEAYRAEWNTRQVDRLTRDFVAEAQQAAAPAAPAVEPAVAPETH